MSMFLPQNMFSKKIGGPLLVACFALTVVGCSRTEQKDNQSGSASSVEQKQLDSSQISCANEKATGAINSYLVNRIEQYAKKQADIIQQQANTTVDMTILQNGLSQMAINLENVNGTNGKCHAKVAFNMPQAQIDNANKIYSRLKMPVVAEQVVSRGYQLQNSTLMTNNVGFGLTSTNGNYQVNSTTGDDVIALVGEIMANSALAQTLTQPSNMPMSGSTPVVVPPTSTQSNVTQTEKKTTVKQQPSSKPKTDSEKTTTKTTRTTTQNSTTEVKTKITPTKTNDQTANTETKTAKKSNSTTDNKAASTKSSTSSSTEKATKPITHDKVPTDSNVTLKIEEKNEQY